MLTLEDARSRMLACFQTLPAETVPLAEAAGRILSAGVEAAVDLPGFDNSSMDGYAVCSTDLRNAGPATPVLLRVIAEIPAGESPSCIVTPGTAARIYTGSPMPAGADAVVMQEDTRRAGDVVEVLDRVMPGENVRLRGEDVRRGETILPAGSALTAGRLALLAATGHGFVRVVRRPVVGILGTGSELCEASAAPVQPPAGKIFESNRAALAPLVAAAGGIPMILPLVEDRLDATRAALESAFAKCDAVITTGGVSVGELDFVKAAFEAMGGTMEFWKVAIRPGKPFVFGRWRDKFLFGLPGNPVSAQVTFLLLAHPALRRWQGAADVQLPASRGVLAERVTNENDRRHFMRVVIDADGMVRSAGPQASHRLASLARANALLDVPPRGVWERDTVVTVLRWD
jgi:molybdopterin molybdotransferase